MKPKFFNFNSVVIDMKRAKLPLCIILFLFGAVLTTSFADIETPTTVPDADTKITKSEDKVEKADKHEEKSAEYFGDGEDDKSDDKPGKKDDSDDEAEAKHPVIPELENETYIELARIGKLDEKQQKLLVKIQKSCKITLERWDKTNEKKIKKMNRRAAEEEKESRRAKLEAKIVAFEAQRDKLAAGFDKRARKVCKPPQLIDYNTEILYRAAMDDFSDAGLDVSDEEALKVKKTCAELARKKYRSPVIDLTRDKKMQFQGVYAVARKALTKEQLKSFKRAKRQEEREKRESTKKSAKNKRNRNR